MNYASKAAHDQHLHKLEPRLGDESPSFKDLRVALFSGNYACTRDGSNRALNMLVSHLLSVGAKVRVYSPTTDQPAFEPQGEVVSVPSVALPRRSEFRLALGLPTATKRDIQSFGPNLVHLAAPDWLGWSALRFAKSLAIPAVASMHTRFEAYLAYYGLGLLEQLALSLQGRFYAGCDSVLAPNEPCRTHLISMGVRSERIGIWGRGVDTQLFSPRNRDHFFRRRLGLDDDDVVVLFLGRLVREKGLECFARTIDGLRASGHAVRPVVVGDGPERMSMRARIPHAIFLGHLEGDDLGRAVASADILLNPSTTEAFGNVNLEAMASGLVVVSADAPSAAALIEHNRDGYLRPADPVSFADQIEDIIRNPLRRAVVRQRAVGSARARSWSVTLNSVLDAYSDALGTTLDPRQGVRARFTK